MSELEVGDIRDEVIRMAREAGLYVGTNLSGVQLVGHEYLPGSVLVHLDVEDLRKFAVIVAAEEREACAKVCDAEHKWLTKIVDRDGAGAAAQCAYKIRARGDA